MASSGIVSAKPQAVPAPQIVYEVLFSGTLLKAGDDNSRWKRRYFQLVAPVGATSNRVRVQYFESDRDVQKGRPPRGELAIGDVIGLAVFGRAGQPFDAAVASCVSLTAEHVQDGHIRLMIWGRDRLWRLAEASSDSNVVGEMIRALDRARLIPKVAVRAAGWMRTQGTLNWNRRYALLLSSGDLMLFRDGSLDQLRRRIELSRAIDIRPLQPLAPAGSQAEKRVLRVLAYSPTGSDLEVTTDGYELVGIRLRHPDITEKHGYVMCVEAGHGDDASAHYARFRRWIVQLQLSAAEARLSGFTSGEVGSSQSPTLVENEELLERKLLQVAHSSVFPQASRENALSVAVPYLLRMSRFPPLWRSSLWFVLSGGATLKKNLGVTYSSLIMRDDSRCRDAVDRISFALLKLDPRISDFHSTLQMLLSVGGEENSFWTLASLAATVTASTSTSLSGGLQGFYHAGFASYVESRVVVDLLGLAHPDVVAHISAYDLTSVLLEQCSAFMTKCNLIDVWDAVTVWGKDALSSATVNLLAEKKNELLECFSEEDLIRVVDACFRNSQAKFKWDQLDVRVVEQVRGAQWSTVAETMRDHSKFVGCWKSVAEESRFLALRAIQQLNRLFPDEGESKDQVSLVHTEAVAIVRLSNECFTLAHRIEQGLEKEMFQTMTEDLVEDMDSEADLLVPMIEELNMRLLTFGFVCDQIAWKSWCAANRLAFRYCRFVPRASINKPSAGASPALSVPPTISPAQLEFVPSMPQATSTNLAPLSSSLPSTSLGSSVSTSLGGEEQQPLSSIDSSRLKSLAIGLGKRFFQQRFRAGSNPEVNSITTTFSTTSPHMPLAMGLDRAPKTPTVLAEESDAVLLSKFRGGYVGLCDVAGSTTDALLVRDSQMKDLELMSMLDELDVMLRITTHAEKLARWMLTKELLAPMSAVPTGLKHLFITQPVSLDRVGLKSLEESHATLCARCMYCATSTG